MCSELTEEFLLEMRFAAFLWAALLIELCGGDSLHDLFLSTSVGDLEGS